MSIRGGTSFWVTAGTRRRALEHPHRAGHVSAGGRARTASCSSGLPLPDIRGTMGTFYYFATDLSRYEEGNTEFGGILKRLVFEGDVAHTELDRPAEPDRPAADRRRFARKGPTLSDGDRDDARGAAGARGRPAAGDDPLERAGEDRDDRRSTDRRFRSSRASGADGSTSTSRINFLVRRPRHGAAAADERRQRAAAVHLAGQLEAGQSAGADVVAGVVLRRSLQARSATTARSGWAEATWPLNEGRMDEKTFMDDLDRAFDDRAQVILNRARRAGTGTCSSASSNRPTACST